MDQSNDRLIRTTKDLRDASFLLRNLFKTGSLGADEILREAGNMVPKWRTQFFAASKLVSNKGLTFHVAVKSIFGPNELSAIRAGEESGKLFEVFDQLWESAKTQQQINKLMRGILPPFAVMFGALVISIAFFLILVPTLIRNMAGTVRSFEPSFAVRAALQCQEWVITNASTLSVSLALFAFVVAGLLSSPNFRESAGQLLVRVCIRFEPFGIAYANLKFGFVSKYLEIVSIAGVPADERLVIVYGLIPEPIRQAFDRFKAEVIAKGLKGAASGIRDDESDPRTSLVQWPPYFRLALFQSHETGMWDEPMREYGIVLVEDGQERLEAIIKLMMRFAILGAGLLLLIPVSLVYGTMGEILILRMRQL